MLSQFKAFIAKHKLCCATDHVLVAVSGGLDSVVMLHLFHRLGQNISVAHCNFGLRGDESDADEVLVKSLADKYNVPFISEKFDIRQYSGRQGGGIQEAARIIRYQWFYRILQERDMQFVATAHHSDDETETFLINLFRGSGIRGLDGIPVINGNIIRPMLFARRTDIEQYARDHKLEYREDSSNLKDCYLRNRIRHSIIPSIRQVKHDALENTVNSIRLLRHTSSLYDFLIHNGGYIKRNNDQTFSIPVAGILKVPEALHLLYELIAPFGFNRTQAVSVLKSAGSLTGKQFFSETHRLVKDRECWIISSKTIQKESFIIQKATTAIDVPFHAKLSVYRRPENLPLTRGKNYLLADAGLLEYPLLLRRWEKGDFFYPLGMKGRKLLSDFFSGQKLSRHHKENLWLLCSGKDIVWICGLRTDRRFMVSDRTKSILEVGISE